jgi:hypothetical protein
MECIEMIGPSLGLFATLIGIFVTPAGIVVASDTAESNGATYERKVRKTCLAGPGRLATLQGHYRFEQGGSERKVDLLGLFQASCVNSVSSSISVEAHAGLIAALLRNLLQSFVDSVTPAAFAPIVTPDPHISYVTVSGYQDAKPIVSIFEVRARPTIGGRWDIFIQPVHVLRECGATFHGENEIVERLRVDDPALPASARGEPAIAILRQSQGDCRNWTFDVAKRAFIAATRLTIDLEPFLTTQRRGVVAAPLDIELITPSGDVTFEEVPTLVR